MAALERLTIGTGFSIFSQTDFATFYSNLQHFGERLAKLEVSARAVARSLGDLPAAHRSVPGEALPAASPGRDAAAMETLSWATYVAVSAAHSDAQKVEAETLLAVLDAELSAETWMRCFERVLKIATHTFSANLGLILMRDAEQQVLRIECARRISRRARRLQLRPRQSAKALQEELRQAASRPILPDLRASRCR